MSKDKKKIEPAQRAQAALQVFTSIARGDKLRYHKTTGLFEIDRGGKNFARAFSNSFRKSGTENSVTNSEMFRRPIVNVFTTTRLTETNEVLTAAYNGLCNLRHTYSNKKLEDDQNAKLKELNETLEEVQNLIAVEPNFPPDGSLKAIKLEFIKKERNIWIDECRRMENELPPAIVQQLSPQDEFSLRKIFGAVSSNQQRLNQKLTLIGHGIDSFSKKRYDADIEYVSKLVYATLQEAEVSLTKAQRKELANGYDAWLARLEIAAANKFMTYFQNSPGKGVNDAAKDHPDSDFLWFQDRKVPSDVSRLYFCPINMNEVDRFVNAASTILRSNNYVFNFKIAYQKNLVFTRKDLVVLYYVGDINVGRALAAEFNTLLTPGFFKPNSGPIGSTSVSQENNVFFQNEPQRFDTGFRAAEKTYVKVNDGKGNMINFRQDRRQHSATSIRAELITMALLKWKIDFDYEIAKCIEGDWELPKLENKETYEIYFQFFKDNVVRAFEGHRHLI